MGQRFLTLIFLLFFFVSSVGAQTPQEIIKNKTRIKERRENFKERLGGIRDERKKRIVERIDEKLSQINERRTQHLNKVLERLNVVLEKIQNKAGELKTQGKDTSALDAAIEAAKTAISNGQTAVSQQEAKDYTADIGDETGLKNAVGTVFKSLQSDLQSVRKTVDEAKKAVMNAAKELKKLQSSDKSNQ